MSSVTSESRSRRAPRAAAKKKVQPRERRRPDAKPRHAPPRKPTGPTRTRPPREIPIAAHSITPGSAAALALPRVVLAGRPNAGKSSLFNRLLRRRKAVVDPTPGVTRDVNEAVAIFDERAVCESRRSLFVVCRNNSRPTTLSR